MHGGAPGSGGPKGSRNGNYKRGLYTADAIASRRWLRQQVRQVKALTKTLRDLTRVRAKPLPTVYGDTELAGVSLTAPKVGFRGVARPEPPANQQGYE
jgi:hypothetical protein